MDDPKRGTFSDDPADDTIVPSPETYTEDVSESTDSDEDLPPDAAGEDVDEDGVHEVDVHGQADKAEEELKED